MINAAGAKAKSFALWTKINESLLAVMPAVAADMIAVASSRAPSMDEEYAELNAEAGEAPLVGRAGGQSADSDGRTRFIKSEDTYLANAVNDPANVMTLGLSVSVGNKAYLNAATHFKYTNLVSHGGTKTYEVGPYFDMFDSGTSGAAVEGLITTFVVSPHDGGDYPLRPGEGSDGERATMIKSIRSRDMFSKFILAQAARAVITRALAEVGPSESSS